MAYKAGILGAAGFAGAELVRLLLGHPEFDLVAITSDSEAGTRIADMYPAFAGHTELALVRHDDPIVATCDVVFLAVPHRAAMAHVPALLDAGVTCIDLSADYRLKDPSVYEKWYGVPHTSAHLLASAAFGLPELNRSELARVAADHAQGNAVLVACAGCYPTATSLAAYPAIHAGYGAQTIFVDAISGVTGAGKTPSARTHFCSANENLAAYSPAASHRHTPEIEQQLGCGVVFTPHLAPLSRGLLSTVNIPLGSDAPRDITSEDIQDLYERFYADDPCVHVTPTGVMPQTSSVTGTCQAHVGVAFDARSRTIVAMGAIDNLCKGAAGQAVQCANIVFGLKETTGLPLVSPAV